jgi:ribosomal protein S18 acetylase RimI-like enzyme
MRMIEKIRLAELNDKDSIVELLNKVTLHLHDKGVNQWEYPWNTEEIKQDIEKGLVYLLIVEDLIVGTFSIKDTDNINTDLIEQGNKYIYRIAILPEYQGKNHGLNIIKFSLDYSRNMDKSLYLDCWAGNEKLRSFYSSTGFDFMGNVPEEDYFVSVFKSGKYPV